MRELALDLQILIKPDSCVPISIAVSGLRPDFSSEGRTFYLATSHRSSWGEFDLATNLHFGSK